MKKFFLFFIIFKAFLAKELTIFYTTNFYNNYDSIIVKGKTVGGVVGLKSKLDELKLKYPNSLKIHLGETKKIEQREEFENYLNILENFKFNVLAVDINQAKNNIKNLPFVSCNIFNEKEEFASKFDKYKNFYIDNNKISVIGVSDPTFEKGNKFDDNLGNLKIKEPIIELKRVLELIKRNFDPHIIIILSTFNSNEFIKILQENKNIVLLLQNPEKINNLKALENKYIIGNKIREHEIGLINLKIEGNEIIDYKTEVMQVITNKKSPIEDNEQEQKDELKGNKEDEEIRRIVENF